MNTSEYSARRAAEMQNKRDQDNLAMAIALESRGEGLEGMFAVAKSILNRHELINTKQVLPSTFMPDSVNSKPTITDILFYPGQYQVVDSKNKKFKKQKTPVTAQDLEQARKAIYLASDTDRAVTYIMDRGLPMEIFDSTGFRRRDAKYDASQDKGTFMIGEHQFNRAGHPGYEADLKAAKEAEENK
jgi:hypothetical protein